MHTILFNGIETQAVALVWTGKYETLDMDFHCVEKREYHIVFPDYSFRFTEPPNIPEKLRMDHIESIECREKREHVEEGLFIDSFVYSDVRMRFHWPERGEEPEHRLEYGFHGGCYLLPHTAEEAALVRQALMDEKEAIDQPTMLTIKEAATYCNCNERTIGNWLKANNPDGSNMIPGVEGTSRRIRIPRASLDQYRRAPRS